jgi:hypothetical protein
MSTANAGNAVGTLPKRAKKKPTKRRIGRKPGQPTKCSPDLTKKFVYHLGRGAYVRHTCAFLGVTERVFYDWVERGKAYRDALEDNQTPRPEDRVYYDFLLETDKARAKPAVEAPKLILDIGKKQKDWRALAWLLERSQPELWGRRKLEVTGSNGGPIRTSNLTGTVSLDDLDESQLTDLYDQLLRGDDEE